MRDEGFISKVGLWLSKITTPNRDQYKTKLDLIQVLKWIYGTAVLFSSLPCQIEEAGSVKQRAPVVQAALFAWP